MAELTVDGLGELTSPAANDEIGIWDVSAGQYLKIRRDTLVGGVITGGGTVATGGYTLTVPGTGTAALLGTANVFTNHQTIDIGKRLYFGNALNVWFMYQDVDSTSAILSLTLNGVGTPLNIKGDGVYPTTLAGGATNVTVDSTGRLIRDPSDVRLKTDINTIENSDALRMVESLRPVSYRWKPEARMGDYDIGFIAQEAAGVMPILVSADASDDAMLSMRYDRLLPLLVGALQAVSERLAAIEISVYRDEL